MEYLIAVVTLVAFAAFVWSRVSKPRKSRPVSDGPAYGPSPVNPKPPQDLR